MDWEKEFYETCMLNGFGLRSTQNPPSMVLSNANADMIKSFIKSLLEAQKAELAEEIINDVPDKVFPNNEEFDMTHIKYGLRAKYLKSDEKEGE